MYAKAANSNGTGQQETTLANESRTTPAANQNGESSQPNLLASRDGLEQNVPLSLLQPVATPAAQNALSKPTSGLRLGKPPALNPVSPERNPPSPSNIYMSAGRTRITTQDNTNYTPRTTTNLVVPHDKILFAYLATQDEGHANNVENMDRRIMKRRIRNYVANPLSAPVLERLGISNLRSLSPRQAMLLSAQIAQDHSEYNEDAVERRNGPESSYTDEARRLQSHMDNLPANHFFRESENGVCRNYAELVQAVFLVLQEMQQPETNQLLNTYVKLPCSRTHMWNAFYTVESNGDVMVSQVDATWNDPGEDGFGETNGKDYTFGRNNVRDYYRQMHLLEGTGNRPLEQFESLLDRGLDLVFMQIKGNGEIDPTEVQKAGGWSLLNREIEKLPEPAQVEALTILSPGAREQFKQWRNHHGFAEIRTEHPQHN
ncbi:MAG: hypothetical protein CMH60_07860 [Myxococcales bacterium]|nr:hypothetical protein [Myxococcales bacterium]|tara:strand:- start:82 stop:1374 length:1293 start_codon:yes stop_codon:yes gene_type:complete